MHLRHIVASGRTDYPLWAGSGLLLFPDAALSTLLAYFRSEAMTKNGLLGAIFSLLATGSAHADVFDVPYEHPALTIAVPERWNPNHSEDGVDAAAPDNALFFSIYTAVENDVAAVQRNSLDILSRNGVLANRQAVSEHSRTFAGLSWVESEYSANEDGKPRQVKLEVSRLSGKRFIQVFIWGSPKGMKENSTGLDEILKTIKLKGR